jgi:hypothetical protein
MTITKARRYRGYRAALKKAAWANYDAACVLLEAAMANYKAVCTDVSRGEYRINCDAAGACLDAAEENYLVARAELDALISLRGHPQGVQSK